MADEVRDDNIMLDLQKHLQIAKVPLASLSSLAKRGDEKLVERFLTENVEITGDTADEAMQSQLYIACFWGFKDIVRALVAKGADVNSQNKGTLWTPLHAACFQEHGPVVMILLENRAQPELPDSENRTPKDFASASQKIWPHFAALGLKQTPKHLLIEMGIIKKVATSNSISPRTSPRVPGAGIRMAAYSRPESAYAYNNDPFMNAAVGGDVLADEDRDGTASSPQQQQPQFTMWK
ncbi:unnamed protein product [Owenia fusiformis]|uniref:Uncharacterized protein n=1 Tax=Owenia fusiformis TaxID=6347 RepID=A0A8J1TTX4_OWEFU|nr:unnamed protein product [Owenia fusiformis]